MSGDTAIHERIAKLETRADNYEKQVEVLHGRIGKLDTHVREGHKAITTQITKSVGELDKRLASLLISKAKAAGALTATLKLLAGGGVVTGLVIAVITLT